MKIVLFLIGLNFLLSIKTEAQKSHETRISFLKGIGFEKLETIVPWGTTFDDIGKYGNPQIYCARKTNTKILWDSVYIFDSIKARFWFFYFRCFQKHKPTGKLNTIYGSIDSIHIPKIKMILDEHSKTSATLSNWKNGYSYYWMIDNCNVRLGYRKNGGAFFDIQTKNKSFW
jgi:hypothetical protein